MKKKPGRQPLHCAIYTRTAAVKEPDEVNSIIQQVERCKRFAKEKEWIVSEDYIFTDSGKSRLTVNSGLKDLMHIAAVNPKPFDVVLCTSTDRITRDADLAIRIHEVLNNYSVEIYFADIGDTQICVRASSSSVHLASALELPFADGRVVVTGVHQALPL